MSALLRTAASRRFVEIKEERRPKEPGIVPVQTPKKENVPPAKAPPRKLAQTEQTQEPLHPHHELRRAVPRHALHPGLASAHSLGRDVSALNTADSARAALTVAELFSDFLVKKGKARTETRRMEKKNRETHARFATCFPLSAKLGGGETSRTCRVIMEQELKI